MTTILTLLAVAASPAVAYQGFSPESRLRLVPRTLGWLQAKGWLTYDGSIT